MACARALLQGRQAVPLGPLKRPIHADCALDDLQRSLSRRRIVLTALWLLTLVGLAVRVWRASSISGSYDEEIDSLVYLSQRWLQGDSSIKRAICVSGRSSSCSTPPQPGWDRSRPTES